MADIFSKKKRSWVMSKVRSSRTVPEMRMKSRLQKLGFAYQPKNVIGNPDFAHVRARIAVFINGCFWHGCRLHYKAPKANWRFWKEKVTYNMKRDGRAAARLRKGGWSCITLWEHDVRKSPGKCLKRVKGALCKRKVF